MEMKVLLLVAVLLPKPIVHEGQLLYPYYCTKTWVCDFVPEDVYRRDCKTRPCQRVQR